jgi:hypothetical protein
MSYVAAYVKDICKIDASYMVSMYGYVRIHVEAKSGYSEHLL